MSKKYWLYWLEPQIWDEVKRSFIGVKSAIETERLLQCPQNRVKSIALS